MDCTELSDRRQGAAGSVKSSIKAQLAAALFRRDHSDDRRERHRFNLRCAALRAALRLHARMEEWSIVLTNRMEEGAI